MSYCSQLTITDTSFVNLKGIHTLNTSRCNQINPSSVMPRLCTPRASTRWLSMDATSPPSRKPNTEITFYSKNRPCRKGGKSRETKRGILPVFLLPSLSAAISQPPSTIGNLEPKPRSTHSCEHLGGRCDVMILPILKYCGSLRPYEVSS